MSLDLTYRAAIHDDLAWFLDQCQAPVVRPISRWVEEELVLPSGPYKGERYKHRRHPVSRLWFDAIGSTHWNRFAASGPTQNGKTLLCYVAPVMYHLFELRETVVIGLPTMTMAQDKWQEDLLPAIEASRYAELLPLAGEGSRGGQVKRAIGFRNGVTLRFMAAGGSDKQKAGFTTRVLAVTETDGMDQPGETSREADAIEQMEARTLAYGSSKRIYFECTASIEKGRIWQEITHGTDSRIHRPCPHCGQYVCPEREHLVGWQDAESEIEAADQAYWRCPSCERPWTDAERRDSAMAGVLVHRGQKAMPNGDVIGEPPPTRTLGFRWSAVDNPFTGTADLGAEEWRATRSTDRQSAEKKMRQFVWCLPWIPPEVSLTPLDAEDVAKRTAALRKGVVPPGCLGIAIGIDTGKQRLHWHATAVLPGDSRHVIEYGEQPTEAADIGMLRGLLQALQELKCYFDAGWNDEAGRRWQPAQVWIDSGWAAHQQAIYEFCRQAASGLAAGQEVYRPAKGFGERQRGTQRYSAPKARTGNIRYIGLHYDMRWQADPQINLVCVNSDYWKGDMHQRLAMSADELGRLTLYDAASSREHAEYGQQITAESQKEQWIQGRGEVIVWERLRRENHYLDAGYLSLAAGHFVAAETQRMSRQQQGWYKQQGKQRSAKWGSRD